LPAPAPGRVAEVQYAQEPQSVPSGEQFVRLDAPRLTP